MFVLDAGCVVVEDAGYSLSRELCHDRVEVVGVVGEERVDLILDTEEGLVIMEEERCYYNNFAEETTTITLRRRLQQ